MACGHNSFSISIDSRFLYVIILSQPTVRFETCPYQLCSINPYQKRDVLTLFLQLFSSKRTVCGYVYGK